MSTDGRNAYGWRQYDVKLSACRRVCHEVMCGFTLRRSFSFTFLFFVVLIYVTPAIEVASRHRLRSANRHRLIVPRCQLNTYVRPRAFPVAGPTVWNSLPDELRDPACYVDSFKQFFKTILFSSY